MHETTSVRYPIQLYGFLRECLVRLESIALATVIMRSGSGPREAGATIVVTGNGKTVGTVGGGLLEANTLEMAQSVIRNRRGDCRTFLLTDKEVSANGMICGGQVEILVDFVDGDNPVALQVMEALLEHEKRGQPCWLVRSIRKAQKTGVLETGLGLMDETGCNWGSLYAGGPATKALLEQCRKKEPSLVGYGDTRYFIQQIDAPETVFIFGAGHVGQELATLCTFAGFRTVIIDDRQEFANRERFPAADEIIVPNSFPECFSSLIINPSAYVVIVTRGHAFDQNVLSSALATSAGYVGMIASRRKRDIIFQTLLREGFAHEDLAEVHSPIGVDIGAQTPAEIAVSIVAELIAVRSGRGKRKAGARRDKE
jgi:xanthine dehydrogenase accessory factor